MATIHTFIEAFIKDVNTEDGRFIQICENATNLLFSLIKWGGIPFIFYLLFEIAKI